MSDQPGTRSLERTSQLRLLVGTALILALAPRPAAAQGDSCQSAIAIAVAQLTQCRSNAEQAFAKNGNETRRDAAYTACRANFDASFASARRSWGATCPDTQPPDVFNDYVAQTTQRAVQGAGGAQLSTFPNVCQSSGGTSVVITNNCSGTENVTVSSGLAGQASPSCLQNLAQGGGSATAYLPAGTNYAFWTGSYGSSTLFEITVGNGGQDWFDISFNQGFDIGMTIVAPSGASVPYIIATDSSAPGAYQLQSTQPSCFDAPCISPNYPAPTGQQWNLYLCNRTNDVNTPGPCGCSICPCSVNRGGPGCNWQDEDCKGLPVPGQGQCPATCPGS